MVSFVIGLTGWDAVRVGEARDRLGSNPWIEAVLVGAAVALLIFGAVMVVVHALGERSWPIVLAVVVAATIIFVVTHPRFGWDLVSSGLHVALLVGLDLFLTLGAFRLALDDLRRDSGRSERQP